MKPLTDQELEKPAIAEMRRQGWAPDMDGDKPLWLSETAAMFACFRTGYWLGVTAISIAPPKAEATKHDGAIIPLSAQYWRGAAKEAKDQDEAVFCMGEAWNHLVNHLYAKATTPQQGWAPGLPRLENNCRREFTVKLRTGKTRTLWWPENYTLDSHGDESQHTGWYTCRENLKEGYTMFFEPYKGAPVQYFQVDLAPNA